MGHEFSNDGTLIPGKRNRFGGVTSTTCPTPTSPEPTMEDVGRWILDSICEATDGCIVEPDGVCHHGHVSWLVYVGII